MTAPARPTGPRRGALLLLGIVSFLAAAIVMAPASLITPFLNSGGANIQYRDVTGSLWKGEIRGVSTGDVYLGDVGYRLRPMALLAGALSADLTAMDGAAIGAGRVNVHLISQRVSVEDANFAFDLSAVRRYSLFGIPYQGRIETRGAGLVWSRDGCSSASGEIWTDVLDASSKTLVGESLLLAGPASCDGGQIHITLKGGNREGVAEFKISIDQSMTYRVMASVDLGRADLENNLRRLGFEDGDGVLVYDVVGALKGVGS